MKPTDNSFSRREFAKRAALGTAAVVAPAHLAPLLYPERALREGLPAQTPAQTAAGGPKLSPQSQAEADFRYQTILAQYPDRFSEEQKADLKRLSFALQPPLDRLRAYSLSNADQPDLYLKPLVEREKKPAPKSSPPAAAKSSVPAKP